MAARKKHTVVLDVVGLEFDDIASGRVPNIAKIAAAGQASKMEPVFPAVTCTVQASILSGKYPGEHGIISNGLYDRDTYSVMFWEQPSKLVQADRVWDIAKRSDPAAKTAAIFLQNSMYANSDIVVTPRPLHTDEGMILWCYSKPVGYYEELKQKYGEFNLAKYWGPFASHESSEWICKAVEHTLEKHRPEITIGYVPHVDYSAQRFGRNSPQARDDLQKADDIVGRIVQKVSELGMQDDTRFIVFSEYGFNDVNGAVPINVSLRESGLLAVRTIAGNEYLDFEMSGAFAMVDHQVAHIYAKPDQVDKAKKVIENMPGVSRVLHSSQEKQSLGINHPRSGELIAISDVDKWFSYYWWLDADKAPEFARKVDIHRKPGYDPVELFFDPKSKSIPLEPRLVKGSHGRPVNPETGEGYAAFVTNVPDTQGGRGNQTIKCTDAARRILGR